MCLGTLVPDELCVPTTLAKTAHVHKQVMLAGTETTGSI